MINDQTLRQAIEEAEERELGVMGEEFAGM